MHQQIRTTAKTSAADVEKLLGRLAEAGVSLSAAGGGDLEFGGEFAFAVHHGMEDAAIRVLKQHGYKYDVIEKGDPRLTTCWMDDKKGELHRCIKGAADENLKTGRIIRDLIIGVPGTEGAPDPKKVPVQIFSEEVRTPQTLGGDTATQSQKRAR